MKLIKSYLDFINEEFNRKDKEYILKDGDNFSIAIEYELCANENPENEPEIEDFDSAYSWTKEQTELNIQRKISYGYVFTMDESDIQNFIIELLDETLEAYEEDELDELYTHSLNIENYKTEDEKLLVEIILNNVLKYFDSQNIDYLIKKLKKKLPNFYAKWGKTFKYELEGDNEKQRIIEFSPKTYVKGLDKAIEQVNDFFADFNKQKYWYFNERTALHINIGILNGKLNPIKGLIIMNDQRDEKIPFVFKNIEHRLPNIHVGSILDKLSAAIKGNIKKDSELDSKRNFLKLDKIKNSIISSDISNDNNLSKVENTLNNLLLDTNLNYWVKEFGLNILQYKKGYCEYRFVGGNISKELFLEKILYFCYITKVMADPNFKKREYQKGLYKYISNLQ